MGNGPYRWIRRDPGRQLELAANPEFFLGAPKLDRLVFLTVRDPEAQINLLLDGTADIFEAVPPVSGPVRLAANPAVKLLNDSIAERAVPPVQSARLRRPDRPHPILGDVEVRRAIAHGASTG